jgi:hypothetical protein
MSDPERLPKIPKRPGEDEQMTSTETSGLARKKRKPKAKQESVSDEIGTVQIEE